MNKHRELPKFTVSHNPLVNESVSYVIVHSSNEGKRATVRIGDWKILEGEINESLLKRLQDWYVQQYLPYINS